MKKKRNKGRDDLSHNVTCQINCHMIMSHGHHMMASHVCDHVTNSLELCMMLPCMYCDYTYLQVIVYEVGSTMGACMLV